MRLKLKCINNTDQEHKLTVGKMYEVNYHDDEKYII
jgi:hypothetical protein